MGLVGWFAIFRWPDMEDCDAFKIRRGAKCNDSWKDPNVGTVKGVAIEAFVGLPVIDSHCCPRFGSTRPYPGRNGILGGVFLSTNLGGIASTFRAFPSPRISGIGTCV